MKETNVQNLIRIEASKDGHVLWRNNRGKVQDKQGRWHVFGVGTNGASDLIGFTEIEITVDMIGRKVAVFTAIEVKAAAGRASGEQLNFIKRVQARGGIAGIAKSYDDVKNILKKYLTL